jgi:hypothetical protein
VLPIPPRPALKLDEAPTDFSLAHTSAVGGTLGNLSGSGTTYTAVFTAAAGKDISNGSVSVDSTWHEANGNPGTGATTAAFVVDTVTPTVAVSINSTTLNLAHNTATVTFTFSEAPVSFVLSDTSAVGGTLSNLQKINATQYTAIFTAATNTLINNASVNVTAGSWQEGNSNAGAAGSTGNFIVDTMDHWTNVSGGKWTTASSWSNGVPSANVEAAVDTNGTYTVSITTAAEETTWTKRGRLSWRPLCFICCDSQRRRSAWSFVAAHKSGFGTKERSS